MVSELCVGDSADQLKKFAELHSVIGSLDLSCFELLSDSHLAHSILKFDKLVRKAYFRVGCKNLNAIFTADKLLFRQLILFKDRLQSLQVCFENGINLNGPDLLASELLPGLKLCDAWQDKSFHKHLKRLRKRGNNLPFAKLVVGKTNQKLKETPAMHGSLVGIVVVEGGVQIKLVDTSAGHLVV